MASGDTMLDPGSLCAAAFRAWADQAATGLALVEGPAHRYVFANRAYATALGRTPAELIGRSIGEIAPDGAPASAGIAVLDRLRAGGESSETILETRCGAVTRRWRIRQRALRDGPQGSVAGVLIEVAETTARPLPALFRPTWPIFPGERLAAEEAERQREAVPRLAVDAGGLGIWELDPATGALAWDTTAHAIYGIAPGTPVNRDVVAALLAPEDRAMAEAAEARALDPAEAAGFDLELRVRRPSDGAWRVLCLRGRALFEGQGAARRAVRMLGVVADVTGRRDTDAALRDGEARLRFALEAGGLGAWSLEVATKAAVWDGRVREIFGVGPEETLDYDKVVWRLIHPDDRHRVHLAAQAALDPAGPGEYAIEHRILRPDGTLRWIAARGRTVFSEDGQRRPLRMTGTVQDITERVRTEAGLAAAEERLRLALEAAELGVCNWNLRSGELTVSDRCRRLYRFAEDSTPDYDALLAALHPEDRPTTEAAIARALEGRSDFDVEHRVPSPDGGECWLRLRGRAELGPDGAVVGLRGVVMDITGQKRAEAALREDKERLEARVAERTRALTLAAAELQAEMRRREEAQAALIQAQKLEALGQLTGGVAHDFNNVLAAVMGSLRLIAKRVPHDERVLVLARNGERAAERAAGLVRQLLAFARREDLAPTVLDPAAVLAGSEELLRRTLGTGVGVSIEAAADVFPVQADRHRLELALLNLAFNARDAMRTSGLLAVSARNVPAGTAADRPASLRDSADWVVLAVRDTGPGMTPEVLARAAEPFFTTKPRGEGTGLGLAMVHGFAQQSGGTMRILSAPGAGTTVEIWLPRVAEPPPTPPEAAQDADPALHGDATVLVVDDDEAVRMVTAAQLRDLGYQVIEANGAESGLVLALATERLDLLVTDVVMPGGDGPSLAARLRAERPEVPVLFVTGFTDDRGILAGEAVLAKPFSQAELAERVLAALRRAPAYSRRGGRRTPRSQ